MIKNWKCGTCKDKILGKIHQGPVLIIKHKGRHDEFTGRFQVRSFCPQCGAENSYSQGLKNIEDFVIGEPETPTES